MSDEERDEQVGQDQESTPQQKPLFNPDGTISWGIDQDGFLTVDGHQVGEKVITEPPEVEGNTIKIGDREYPADKIEDLIRRAEEVDSRMEKVMEIQSEIEPYAHVFESDRFRQFLEESVADGSIEPPQFPRPTVEDEAGYHARMERPGSMMIVDALRQMAERLPEYEAEALNSNAAFFNRQFDALEKSLKKEMGNLKGRPSVAEARRQAAMPQTVDPKILRKALGRFEVERPQVGPDPEREAINRERRRERQLVEWARQGDRDSLQEIAQGFFREPKPKRSDY